MTKYFCDFCGKEMLCDELKSIVINDPKKDAKEYYDICEDCTNKIYEIIKGKKLREDKNAQDNL